MTKLTRLNKGGWTPREEKMNRRRSIDKIGLDFNTGRNFDRLLIRGTIMDVIPNSTTFLLAKFKIIGFQQRWKVESRHC